MTEISFEKAQQIKNRIIKLEEQRQLLLDFRSDANLSRDISLRDVFDAIGTDSVHRIIGERLSLLENALETQRDTFFKL